MKKRKIKTAALKATTFTRYYYEEATERGRNMFTRLVLAEKGFLPADFEVPRDVVTTMKIGGSM